MGNVPDSPVHASDERRSISTPALIVRLTDPPRVSIIAADLEQQHQVQGIARAIEWLLTVLEWKAA